MKSRRPGEGKSLESKDLDATLEEFRRRREQRRRNSGSPSASRPGHAARKIRQQSHKQQSHSAPIASLAEEQRQKELQRRRLESELDHEFDRTETLKPSLGKLTISETLQEELSSFEAQPVARAARPLRQDFPKPAQRDRHTHDARGKTDKAALRRSRIQKMLSDPSAAKYAIILSEILGPPVGLRPPDDRFRM